MDGDVCVVCVWEFLTNGKQYWKVDTFLWVRPQNFENGTRQTPWKGKKATTTQDSNNNNNFQPFPLYQRLNKANANAKAIFT